MLSNLVWSYHSVFGIVHPSGCNVCLSYMRHVANATQFDIQDNSLRLAIKDRDSQGSIQYLNGVSEGIRLQAQEFDVPALDLIEERQSERDELLQMLDLRTAQLVAVEQEFIQVKEQFKALQALLDDAAVIPTSADFLGCIESSTTHPQVVQNAEASRDDQLKPADTLPLPTPPTTPPTTESDLSSFWSSDQGMNEHSDSAPSIASFSYYSPVVNDATVEQAWDSMVVPSLQELAVLLSKARSGDDQASVTVDSIYTAARSLPEVERTTYHQFVILEWKPRHLASSTPVVTPAVLSRRTRSTTHSVKSDIPEIFVDSSGWGIGFVLNGRWLAWKLRPGWRADGRDNNWAEMVAVELGLLVVASAGFRSRSVIVRSDNTGVVKALQKGTSKHPRQPEVLKRIEAITKRHGYALEIQWVSTEHNLADGPSRGHLPPGTLRFPATIDIPEELLPFLTSTT